MVVVVGPRTGLPIPAHAEIAFEGFVHPNDLIDEGPLGEWTGYYAGGLKKEPAIRVETFMHRDRPILLVLRVSRSDQPSVRSLRRPLEDVLVFAD